MSSYIKQTYFEQKYASLIAKGQSCEEASSEVINAYLAGKPRRTKTQLKINKEHTFWSSKFLWNSSVKVLNSDSFVLALAKYFNQDYTSNYNLLEHVTRTAPEAIVKGIRRSEIVLRPESDKWLEVKRLAECMPDELAELIEVCEQFQVEHKTLTDVLVEHQKPFKKLSIFELLSYSSLYSFRRFVEPTSGLDEELISIDDNFRALRKILEWKISISEQTSFRLTDRSIAESLKIHLSPIIFPSNIDSSVPDTLLAQFSELIKVQVELDGFLSRSVVPFCFDDEIRYSLNGKQLKLTVLDDTETNAWILNGRKLALLDGYWINRGLNEFINSGMAGKQIGLEDNHNQNRIAYIKALGSSLQLNEIYGIDKTVQTDNGMDVNIFQALLSLELMIAFYNKDYIEVFYRENENTGHWQTSLGMMAMGGMLDQSGYNIQNRFPLTWSNWKQKAKSIVGWTVSDIFPNGNVKAAEAILDFWSLDFKKWSTALKRNNSQNLPELTERPILKLGNYSIQLPWLMATQLTGVNVINNLRRFANNRPELKSETSRIEERLGQSFKKRGFKVLTNYVPENCDAFNPGEIDLICKLDNIVLVIEVKSTYRRNSQREAIGYKNNSLRKAGIQLKHKTEAVKHLLVSNDEFNLSLGIDNIERCTVIGWISDSCLEFDHEYFNGHLKVSIEELHIALADNAGLLVDMAELGQQEHYEEKLTSLYQEGFNAKGFVDVIELSKVWVSKLN